MHPQNLTSIKVLFFGATAEAAGTREEVLELDETIDIETAVLTLVDRYPRLQGRKLLAAVNEEYVASDTQLNDGDELAIFTAVSGG